MIEYYEKPVKPDNTEWRDEEISKRHREWGWNCPVVDIDFLVCEFNLGKPVALIEYKKHRVKKVYDGDINYRVLRDLADARFNPLPFFVCFYWPEIWAFKVVPMNETARSIMIDEVVMTEFDYVSFLYKLRRIALKNELSDKLKRELPSDV